VQDRRLTVALLVAVVIVVLLGSGAALAISHNSSRAGQSTDLPVAGRPATDQNSVGGSAASTDATGSVGSTPLDGPTGDVPSPTAPGTSGADPSVADPAASTDPTQPTGPSNNLTVQMSEEARSHDRAGEAQQLLQSYFDAINQHNYTSWSQTVTADASRTQNSAQWLQAYATTVDSSIVMQSVQDDPLEVSVSFTSQQDKDLAPKALPASCIRWTLTYRLLTEGDRLVVGSTAAGSVQMKECS